MIKVSKISATLRCTKLTDYMSDNFYINGSCPLEGSVPVDRTVTRSVNGKSGIFAVSNGIGSGINIETAAFKVLSSLKNYQTKLLASTLDDTPSLIEDYLDNANGIVNSLGSVGPGGASGASLAMLIINQDVATAVNVGNARVYAYQYGRLNRISEDDTETARLLSVGAIRKEEEMTHESRSLLTKYVGIVPQGGIKPHYSSPIPINKGDAFLICSNGLTDFLPEERIARIMSLNSPDERLVQRLISEAIVRGADDNVTAMIVRPRKSGFAPNKKSKGILKASLSAVLLAFVIFLLVKLISLIIDIAKPEPAPPTTPPPVTETEEPETEPEMILREQ